MHRTRIYHTATVYCLICPLTNCVRYIGCTVSPLNLRLSGHCSYWAETNRLKREWIENLAKVGLKPSIHAIETVYRHEAKGREDYWISFFREQGTVLVNIRDIKYLWVPGPDSPQRQYQISQVKRFAAIRREQKASLSPR